MAAAPSPRAAGPPPATPARAACPSDAATLVAGQAGPVDFADPGAMPAAAGTLPLYTRAADLMEAAVAVQLGRTIDLTA